MRLQTYLAESKRPSDMPWEEYLAIINPGNVKLSDSQRPNVYADDIEGMADEAKTIKTVAGFVIKTDGSSFFALKNGKEVGFVSELSDTEIDLAVAKEYQKKGIGTILLTEYRKKFPWHQTGGLTDAGLKTELAVYRSTK
jgi:GNAT superfamily N-acetyltransferase